MNKNKIIGIGTDIERVIRFKEKPYENNSNFYSRIFDEEEITECLNKPCPEESFAVRFAAKEAIIKSLSSKEKLTFEQITIKNENGIPKPQIKKKTLKNILILLSISHTKDTALAFAISLNG